MSDNKHSYVEIRQKIETYPKGWKAVWYALVAAITGGQLPGICRDCTIAFRIYASHPDYKIYGTELIIDYGDEK